MRRSMMILALLLAGPWLAAASAQGPVQVDLASMRALLEQEPQWRTHFTAKDGVAWCHDAEALEAYARVNGTAPVEMPPALTSGEAPANTSSKVQGELQTVQKAAADAAEAPVPASNAGNETLKEQHRATAIPALSPDAVAPVRNNNATPQ